MKGFRSRHMLFMLAVLLTHAPPAQPESGSKQAYFGDLHLHTALSFDAFLFGTRLLPADAYRYARGEEVDFMGTRVKRKAPLDFLAVTDHSEYLGVMRQIDYPNDVGGGPGWQRIKQSGKNAMGKVVELVRSFEPGRGVQEFLNEERLRTHWQLVIDAAEQYNEPGKFTTFVAYEWTSMPDIVNIHRNVIFKGPKYPARPFSAIDSQRPEDLWAFLERNRKAGIESLAIPHNANLSNGLMYQYVDSDGKPVSREYAEARLGNEPLAEVIQHKGNSETHPGLSPNDEFAGFELAGGHITKGADITLHGSFIREGYARGLEIANRIGINPYKMGFVGATDFHTGLSTTEEDRYVGGGFSNENFTDADKRAVLTTNQRFTGDPPTLASASGLTGVWAEQNSREAIYDALKRKEVFATSGNRMQVRFFAGWHYPQHVLKQADWLGTAYARGVPMGADLPAGPASSAPRFIVQAVKDPDGGNLDRIQIVKVWNQRGVSHEKVFDVVWSGKRKPDSKSGRLPAVGNTVDLETATYSNSIGAIELAATWEDPEFNPQISAVYYARVIEIPTPRWTAYWAVQARLPLPANVPPTVQERAWTSPIFYSGT